MPTISILRKRFSEYLRVTTDEIIAPTRAKNGAIKTMGIKSKVFATRSREIWRKKSSTEEAGLKIRPPICVTIMPAGMERINAQAPRNHGRCRKGIFCSCEISMIKNFLLPQ